MLLCEHKPDFGVVQSSVKLCFYATPAGDLTLKGIDDTLHALSRREYLSFPDEYSALLQKSSIGEFLHSISKHFVDF